MPDKIENPINIVIDDQGADTPNLNDINNKDIDKDKNTDLNKDDLSSKDNNAEISIDDKSYKLDDEGNALNEDGTIFMSKEDIEKLEASDEESDDIRSIQEKIGYIPVDQNGKEIVYENSVEGIVQYIQDSALYMAQQKYNEDFNKFIESRSWIREAIEYEDKNGTIEGFKPGIDWDKVELKQEDEDSIKNVIIQAQLAKGDTLEDAEMYYTLLKDANKTIESAQKAKQFLVNKEKSERELANQRARIAAELEAKQAREEMEEVKNKILNKSEITVGDRTLSIPKVININENGKIVTKTPEDFFRYIYEPKVYEINGRRQEMTEYAYRTMINNSKRTIDDDLYDAYLSFVNGDTKSLIDRTIKREEFNNKKKLFTKSFTSKQQTKTNTNNSNIVLPIK